MKIYRFRDRDYTDIGVIDTLWAEYIGQRRDIPFSERVNQLQISIRRCLQDERKAYKAHAATIGRVSETHGHAILVGKIKAGLQK